MLRSVFESFVIHSFVLVFLFAIAAVDYGRETPETIALDIIISSMLITDAAVSSAPEAEPAPLPAASAETAVKKPEPMKTPVGTVKKTTSKPAAKPVPVPEISEPTSIIAESGTVADGIFSETEGNAEQSAEAAAGGYGTVQSAHGTNALTGGGAPPFDFNGLKNRLTNGIDRNKTYPYNARRRGYEGTVLVRLMIDCEGRLEDIDMVESSGFDLLDKEAMMLVASVFPIKEKLPEPVTLLIPVDYSLNN